MKKFILNKIQKGFTPMELLLVIGISAVVAGLFVFTANAPQQQAALPPINVNVGAPNITVNPPDVNVNVEPARITMNQPDVNVNVGQAPGRTAGVMAGANPSLCSGAHLSWDGTTNTCTVAPSNDPSHVTDAGNIRAALSAVGDSGGTVLLSDGNAATPDHYYAHTGILALGFSGTLKGEDKYNTVVEAVRGPNGEPFELLDDNGFEYVSDNWMHLPGEKTANPVLFFFDYPGALTIEDMTMQANEQTYVDTPYLMTGTSSNALGGFIVLLGGPDNTDTAIRRIKLDGEGNGNYTGRGKNVVYGIKLSKGTFDNITYVPGVNNNFVFEDVDLEDLAWGMWTRSFKDSTLSFTGTKSLRVLVPISPWGVFRNSQITIDNNELTNSHTSDIEVGTESDPDTTILITNTKSLGGERSGSAVYLGRAPNATISHNEFTASKCFVTIWSANSPNGLIDDNDINCGLPFYSIFLNGSSNSLVKNNRINAKPALGSIGLVNTGDSTISNNTFYDLPGHPIPIFIAAVVIQNRSGNRVLNNDYSQSGLPGFVNASIRGGTVSLYPATSNTQIIQSVSPTGTKFPFGTSLCTPQVLDRGTGNNVTGYAACENNPNWFSILQNACEKDGGTWNSSLRACEDLPLPVLPSNPSL